MITPFVKFNKTKLSGAALKLALTCLVLFFVVQMSMKGQKGCEIEYKERKKEQEENKNEKEKEKGIGNESRQMIK